MRNKAYYLTMSICIVIWSILCFLLVMHGHADTNKASYVLQKATVQITGGTGSLVHGRSGRRYILTNWHVCIGALYKQTLSARFIDGNVITGTFASADESIDLCAAQVTDKVYALTIAPEVFKKEHITTRGYPSGHLVESAGELLDPVDWEYVIRGRLMPFSSTTTTLYSKPGASGSPIVDDNGNLVGVISSYSEFEDNAAGSVTFDQLSGFLANL